MENTEQLYNFLKERIDIVKNKKFSKESSVTLEEIICEFEERIMQEHDSEQRTVDKNYNEIVDSWLYFSYFTRFAVAIDQKDNDGLLPIDMLDNGMNPNTLICNSYFNLANLILSIIQLCKKGQQYAAGIIIRSLFELCCIIAVILFDKNKMELYCKTGTESMESDEVWYKHFRAKEILKKVNMIEKTLMPDDEINDEMKLVRKEMYAMYSGNAHHSFPHNMLAPFSLAGDNIDILELCLLGNYNAGITGTINNLNDILFYFSNLFNKIIFSYHGYKIKKGSIIWSETFVCKELAQDLYMYYRIDDNFE